MGLSAQLIQFYILVSYYFALPLAHFHLLPVYARLMVLDTLLYFWIYYRYGIHFFENPSWCVGQLQLWVFQDLLPTPTVASFDCSVIHIPSDPGKIWVSVDLKKFIRSGSYGWWFKKFGWVGMHCLNSICWGFFLAIFPFKMTVYEPYISWERRM